MHILKHKNNFFSLSWQTAIIPYRLKIILYSSCLHDFYFPKKLLHSFFYFRNNLKDVNLLNKGITIFIKLPSCPVTKCDSVKGELFTLFHTLVCLWLKRLRGGGRRGGEQEGQIDITMFVCVRACARERGFDFQVSSNKLKRDQKSSNVKRRTQKLFV